MFEARASHEQAARQTKNQSKSVFSHRVLPVRRNARASYGTVPYYFPTEQVDIVDKLRRNRKKQKK